jgi:hypothetical protein
MRSFATIIFTLLASTLVAAAPMPAESEFPTINPGFNRVTIPCIPKSAKRNEEGLSAAEVASLRTRRICPEPALGLEPDFNTVEGR